MTPAAVDGTRYVDQLRPRLAALRRDFTPADVAQALRAEGHVVSDAVVLATVEALRRESVGAGPLDHLVREPGVADVLVNGPDRVYVDRGRGLELTAVRFSSDEEVRRLASRLAATAGRRLDEGSPYVDARLPDGTRVHAVLACVASPGTCISLRIPMRGTFTLAEWVSGGSVAPEIATLLSALVRRREAFLISGGTGSGKTTLLATLLGMVPAQERLVIVEDSRELNPNHPHVVRMEGRPANAEGVGAVTLTALVRQALRMRPDRLVVGEVRGAELVDLLMALNTGHEGGCGTVHANSSADVPARLEALGSLGGLGRDALHAQLGSALRVLVHVRRWPDGQRMVSELAVLQRDDATGRVRAVSGVSVARDGALRRGPAWAELVRLVGAEAP